MKLARALTLALLAAFSAGGPLPVHAEALNAPVMEAAPLLRANFKGETASWDALMVANWVVRNNKNAGQPFIIADKPNGLLFAFHENGELFAKTRALYGAMKSDSMTDEQAAKALGELSGADMITPAGIFTAHAYFFHRTCASCAWRCDAGGGAVVQAALR